MYNLSNNQANIVILARNTRLHQKRGFQTETRIGSKYANSPFYRGTKLWNSLTKEKQDSDTIYAFKNITMKYNKPYKGLGRPLLRMCPIVQR